MPSRRSFAVRHGVSPVSTSAVWTPARLFSSPYNNTGGGWYDPSDMSTLFQDIAGTTPVTASGQSVGKMLDKTGRNHLYAPSNAQRPTFIINGTKRYLTTTNTQLMISDAGVNSAMAIGTCQGYAVCQWTGSNLATNGFGRFGSFGGSTTVDTTNSASQGGMAFFMQGVATWFALRTNGSAPAGSMLNTAYPGTTNTTPLGCYEYYVDVNGQGSNVNYSSNGTSFTTGSADSSFALASTFSNGRIGICTHVDGTQASGYNANGTFVGNWYGWVHVGRLLSVAEQTEIRNWMKSKFI